MTDDDIETEPAAEVRLSTAWAFRLGPRDAGLVLRALGNRLTPDDVEPARELGDRLLALQERGASDLLRGREQAVERMREAREGRGQDPDPLARRRR